MENFWVFIPPFGVRRGPEMILSHRAPSSLNMSPYRAIWTHFKPIFIFFEPNNTRSWSQNPDSGSMKLFLLGGCRPPGPPGGGPAAPHAPSQIFERLRLSSSPFWGVPRSWYQDLGTKMEPTWNQHGTQMKPKFKDWNQNGTKTQGWNLTGTNMEPK